MELTAEREIEFIRILYLFHKSINARVKASHLQVLEHWLGKETPLI